MCSLIFRNNSSFRDVSWISSIVTALGIASDMSEFTKCSASLISWSVAGNGERDNTSDALVCPGSY